MYLPALLTADFILQGWLCMPCCYAREYKMLCTSHKGNIDVRKNEPTRDPVVAQLIYAFNCKQDHVCTSYLIKGNEALKLVRAPDKENYYSSSFVCCMSSSYSCVKINKRLS